MLQLVLFTQDIVLRSMQIYVLAELLTYFSYREKIVIFINCETQGEDEVSDRKI